MTRPLSFRVRPAPPAADRLPVRSAAVVITLIVIVTWFACVAGAWLLAGAVRMVAQVPT